ncbi:alpha/beta hydrolase fold domain-containing protein [Pseudonocardia humida]|uniref:Alpha/beta hydrolase fold domain-containing protein n=1 Tax=Pseudonocardia humida TaxID=2800819 RepID=A0ABT0ZTI5_9PSEU|nr:alpha/beta hydrolase fold domain-containing protein [Pseudonocardia humida]MCO1654038.1 alpha/beta hydrolase fold domain-containing protein [Pseudonocardia humida]
MTVQSSGQSSGQTPVAQTRPGRLGDPHLELRTDPRSDPRMVAALAPFGLDGAGEPPPVDRTSPREAQLAFLAEAEAGFEAVFAALMQDLPPVEGVERSTETVTGPDGDPITLFISRPAGADGPLPGVLHIHGGGMVILSAAGPAYARVRDEIAATGAVVVGAEYRNGAGALGAHPFPAGLDDCTAALRWVHEHRARLGISTLTLAGESGGANLALATTLRAKRDGHVHTIDGVYAMVPYISGLYGGTGAERERALPSLVENDGYFISCALLDVMNAVYDPGGRHATDPLAWPYHASVDEVTGLPPHVISVCEVDPLRDEGIAYHRTLQRAGVPAALRVVPGTCHAGDVIFRAAMPEVFAATMADIHGFVSGL